MNPERFLAIKRIFLRALQCPPGRREDLLREECDGDEELRSWVEQLLSVASSPSDVLAGPVLGDNFNLPALESFEFEKALDWRGWQLENYDLEERLGRGGMGVVYRAKQHPLGRDVALKVLLSVEASVETMHRFQAEGKLLGRLQHPGIAQIFEAGAAETDHGLQPFLAMEFVRGRSLLAHARAEQLDTRARAALLVKACDAVQHAHERGVLHRDLKPSNVLVNAAGQPKIIDFGIASAMNAAFGNALGPKGGTPAYLSPELLLSTSTPAPLADRRSDIYALGLLAYELFARVSAEEEGFVGLAAKALFASRRAPFELGRSVGAELAAIVRRATQPRPEQRYQSAAELGADLQRYLADEPVAARGRGLVYLAGKSWRRRRLRYVAAGLVAASVLASFAALSLRERAASEARRADDQENVARAQADRAERFEQYLLGTLSAADPLRLGPDGSLAELLERIRGEARETFRDDPELEIAVRLTLAFVDRRNGRLERAEAEIRGAQALGIRALGARHPATLEATQALGVLALDRGQLEEAERLFRDVLAACTDDRSRIRPLLNLGSALAQWGRFAEAADVWHQYLAIPGDEAGRLDLLRVRAGLRFIETDSGRSDRMEHLYRQAMQASTAVLGPAHPETLAATCSLAVFLFESGRGQDEALALLEAAWNEAAAVFGPEHLETLRVTHALACAQEVAGKLGPALENAAVVWDGRRVQLGADHPATLASLHNLARFSARSGDPVQARELYAELAERVERALPAGHWYRWLLLGSYGEFLRVQNDLPRALDALERCVAELERGADGGLAPRLSPALRDRSLTLRMNLGLALENLGDFERALMILGEVHAERRAMFGPDDLVTLIAAHNLATALAASGDLERSETLLREVLLAREQQLGPAHPRALHTRFELADVISSRGQRPAAIELYMSVIERAQAARTPDPDLPLYLASLGTELRDSGRLDEAEEQCRAAVAALERLGGASAHRRADVLFGLGRLLEERREYAEAEGLLREVLEILKETRGSDHPDAARARHSLAGVLAGLGRADEACALFEATLELRRRILGPSDTRTLSTQNNYAHTLAGNGRSEEALVLYADLVERAAETRARFDPLLALFRGNFGQCLVTQGLDDEAREALEAALVSYARRRGADALPPAFAHTLRGVYQRAGEDPERALAELVKVCSNSSRGR